MLYYSLAQHSLNEMIYMLHYNLTQHSLKKLDTCQT